MKSAPAPRITFIGVLFRFLGSMFRWLVSGATAFYRDGEVRMEGERSARWSPLDRFERWWSCAFYALLLMWGASAGFSIPWIEDSAAARVAGIVTLTVLAVWVAVLLARRVVVSLTRDPWTAREMATDGVHLSGIGVVVLLVPVTLVATPAMTPVYVVLVAIAAGGFSGLWASFTIRADHAAKRRYLGFIRAAFGGSDEQWSRSRFNADRRRIVIRHTPASAFSDLTGSDQKLAQVAPDWECDFDQSSAAKSILLLVRTTSETRASREIIARSEGLIVRVSAHYHPGTFRYDLAPSTPVSAYPRADAIAQQDGLRIVEWQPTNGFAIAAPLDHTTARLRDTFAAYTGYQPHEVEIDVRSDGEGRPEGVTVSRYPRAAANLDRLKRLSLWRSILEATIPVEEGYVWRVIDRIEDGAIDLVRSPDLIKDIVTRDEFTERFPSDGDWRQFPVAIREDGEPVIYTAFSTLIVGQTGAGKGSVIWSVLGGMLDAAKRGEARFYAIDPKGAEAIGDDGSPRAMFEQVATTPDEWADMLANLVEDMNSRKGKGRKLDPKDYPVTIIFIDELSALSALETDSRRAAEVMANLLLIASQGRSLNYFTLAAVQAPQKDMVGKLREFLAMRIALRTGTELETDLALGADSVASGALSHLIPVATPGNGYATAGTGYMKIDGVPDPVRVRFPYTDDATLDRWDAEFSELRATGVLPEVGAKSEEAHPWDSQFDEPMPEPVAIVLDDDIDFDAPLAEFNLDDLIVE